MHYDVIIVGGGIVGFSTAFQLLQREPHLKVAVLEKETQFGQHQTGHNSGVIHAGVYYQPGSLKAKFCVEGCGAIKTFCEEHSIPFKVPGKLIVATSEAELIGMQKLATRCVANGLTIENLTASEVVKRQPGLSAVGGFFVKETGIVNWRTVCEQYAKLFKNLGGKIFYQQQVSAIKESGRDVVITTRNKNIYLCSHLITCSGLYADRLVRMSGLKANFKIVPFRGEYFKLKPTYNNYFKHLIYPVPDPKLPFLGVHFTPQIGGFATVGPSAVLALAREGYGWNKINLKDCLETLTYWPAWKLIMKNLAATGEQLLSSMFKNYYLKLAQKYVPSIKRQDLEKYPAGVRAQAVDKAGNFIKDFLFMESDRILHTCNAPSPAATSSLPIGNYIVERFMVKIT
ncbi:MAG: L-2-hydroxyglutarate oxidase [Gammaproteobacteria bacterium]|nr:L-2-hydroxyglutarate oxidase [Gammaproteobacteria bacterium]